MAGPFFLGIVGIVGIVGEVGEVRYIYHEKDTFGPFLISRVNGVPAWGITILSEASS